MRHTLPIGFALFLMLFSLLVLLLERLRFVVL